MSLGHVHLTPQLVAAVRQAVDVVAIAEDHTRLTRRGKRTTGLCPLHREKSPSFTVDPDQGLFYCFGCGQGGDAIRLHMLLSGDDFPAAIETLARRFGVPLPTAGPRSGSRSGTTERDLEAVLEEAARWFAARLDGAEGPRKYLEERGIPLELAHRYGVGYAPPGYENLLRALAPKIPAAALEAAGLVSPSERHPGQHFDRFRNRLIFPIRAASGALVGFGGRALGDDKAKYLNTSETERFRKGTLLYGLDQAKRAIREQGRALLVEGYFDVLGAVAAGVEGAVASMGTALTAEQAGLLARYSEEVVVGYDGDRAGEEASRRALAVLLGAGMAVRRAQLPAGADPDSLRLEQGAEALQRLVASAPDAVEHELARLVPAGAPDPQTQARLAGAATELLQPVKDPILRWAYGRRAAERLGLPFELLAPRLGKAPAPPARRAAPAAAAAAAAGGRAPGRLIEEGALRALLALLPGGESAAPVPDAGTFPPADVFWNDACRHVYATFRVLLEERGEAPPVAALQERLGAEGGNSVDLVARLVIEGPDQPGGLPGRAVPSCEETLRRYLRELDRRWRQRRLVELNRDINEAQRAGDGPRLHSLVEERSLLSREVHLGGGPVPVPPSPAR
jgi:DNA primase